MLQNIRDRAQGFIAWIVVALIVITFALWGIHSYIVGGSSTNTNVAAKVNGQEVPFTAVTATYERLRQQQQMQMGADFSLSQSAETDLKKKALDQLIVSTVLTQAAVKSGFRVTDDQVNEALLLVPAFQINGQFSRQRFEEVLGSVLYSEDQFISDMRAEMMINQVKGGFVNSAFALPTDVNNSVRLVNQKRNISYLIVPANHFTNSIQVTDKDIKNYYQQHQNQFQAPEQVSVDYLELSLPAIKAGLHFDPTKLQQYYEDNIDSYMTPMRWHVAHILAKVPANATPQQVAAAQAKINNIAKQLAAGGDFNQLARSESDDPSSASQGGVLDWFSQGSLDPAFEKAVANLQNIGDVSSPVRTQYGFSIIKLLGEQKPQTQPFNQVQQQVQNALAQQQAEQIFADATDKLSNLTYANPDSLDVASKALNIPIQSTGWFGRDGDKQGITANPRVLAVAFSNDVLGQGNNSDIITLDPNTVIVLRVRQHKLASLMPFGEVQPLIKDKLIADLAQQKAKALGQTLLTDLDKNNAAIADLSKQYNLPLQNDNAAGRYDSQVDAAILNEAFRMPRPEGNKPSTNGLQLPSGDFAVIVLNAITDGATPSNGSVEQRVFQEEMENNLGHIDYEFYVRDLMNHAKIVNNNTTANTDNSDDN